MVIKFTEDSLTLENALDAHSKWTEWLKAIASSGEKIDVETIKRDDCCELGKWLHSSGGMVYGHSPRFTRLVATHKEFHAIAGAIAQEISDSSYKVAESMLQAGTPFAYASEEVAMAIMELKTEAEGLFQDWKKP